MMLMVSQLFLATISLWFVAYFPYCDNHCYVLVTQSSMHDSRTEILSLAIKMTSKLYFHHECAIPSYG